MFSLALRVFSLSCVNWRFPCRIFYTLCSRVCSNRRYCLLCPQNPLCPHLHHSPRIPSQKRYTHSNRQSEEVFELAGGRDRQTQDDMHQTLRLCDDMHTCRNVNSSPFSFSSLCTGGDHPSDLFIQLSNTLSGTGARSQFLISNSVMSIYSLHGYHHLLPSPIPHLHRHSHSHSPTCHHPCHHLTLPPRPHLFLLWMR